MSTFPSTGSAPGGRPETGRGGFAGNRRFELKRRLGEGSMGAVYLAYDRERGADVALKTLRRVDAAGIYRFKREFRALSDVVHPNLVVLHDLFSEDDEWFFTMEYVQGQDFLSYVLGHGRTPPAGTPRATPDLFDSDELRRRDSGELSARGLEMLFPSPLHDEEAFRSVLMQVASGLLAIHAAGKLHRDLKSDNVLVTAEGQAKVLDFGIVIERAASPHSTLEIGVMGTPAYMSPEQAAGRPVSDATDWYALGVMMYEALTGAVPFEGTYFEVMQQKQELDSPAPSQVVSGVSPDLDELCVQLLQRNPSARPRGLSVLRALERRRSASVRPPSSMPAEPDTPFVGRVSELASLRRYLALTDRGRPVVASVHGPSGIGKTTLVERFIGEQRVAARAIVLNGRCYERELVPFKAFDTLIDALSRYLRRIPSVEAAETLPRDILALAQLFPVLKRVDVVAAAKRRARLLPDRKELRRRAFAALKELLCRIADRTPLVLFIDDLQWGDVDSARLMAELIKSPEAPAMLVVLAYRHGDASTSPCLQALFEHTRDNRDADLLEVPVGPLDLEESRELARQLIGADVPAAVNSVGRECRGNPHLLTELVRHVLDAQQHGTASLDTRDGTVSFERALLRRVAELSHGARTLLELVSVAGRPVAEEVLALVSTFDVDLQDALVELRGAKLIRGVGTLQRRAIETYHDRIREAVIAAMDVEQLTRWHRRLASTLEASGSDDLEAVTEHLLGAGDARRAQIYAIRAATQAAEALAFEKAARLFAIAVQHEEDDEAWGHELLVKWAQSLVNAGRAAQAASVFFEAARSAPSKEAIALRRAAGVQLLLCGQREQAMQLLAPSLGSLGVLLPRDDQHAAQRLSEVQAFLRKRGFGFAPRDEQELPAEALERLDLCWSLAWGLCAMEPARALCLVADYLVAALELGEPVRIVRGLCAYHAWIELGESALGGAAPLGGLRAARELLRELHDDERGAAWVCFAEAHEALWDGDCPSALASLSRAEELFRTRCAGAASEMRGCRVLLSVLWVMLGETERLRRIEDWTAEAEEHEDLVGATRLRLLTAHSALLAGEPERAARRVEQTLARFGAPADPFTALVAGFARTQYVLFVGDAEACVAGLLRFERLLEQPFAQLPLVRGQLWCARARLAVAAAEHAVEETVEETVAENTALAERDLQHVIELRLGAHGQHVRLIGAAIALRRGDRERAMGMLDAVLENPLDEIDALFTAAAAQRAKGKLLGGEEGLRLVARADAALREQGVADPARYCRLYIPPA